MKKLSLLVFVGAFSACVSAGKSTTLKVHEVDFCSEAKDPAKWTVFRDNRLGLCWARVEQGHSYGLLLDCSIVDYCLK